MFTLLKEDGQARAGLLKLHHGDVETPIFMPVGTVGSVKSLLPEDLETLGAQIILANTYHLYLRPGLEVINHHKGLHQFISWKKPILTDSGGFQVFSLAKLRKMTEEGVQFASHLDGKRFCLSPEKAVLIQESLRSDIHMVLDECTPYPVTEKEALASMQLSLRWAKRSQAAKTIDELKQFAIVQGGVYPQLRRQAARALEDMNFDGYAIGGLSVGEPKEAMREMTAVSCQELPLAKPRYLMGVGTPLDLIESVAVGVDMFDCVMPTRNGRNGSLFTSEGKISIKNAKHKFSDEPLDAQCSCYTCKNFSRSYLRHLFVAGELSSMRLLSLHNLTFYLKFMKEIREAILAGRFEILLKEQRDLWQA